MSYYMSDEEPLALPPMLPILSSTELAPPSSDNVLDMISQDMLLGSSFKGSSSSASTEVTYTSQYAASSTAPFTSAGDVFLPNLPITTASNTFVKPMNTFVHPLPPKRSAKLLMKSSPRHGSVHTTPRSVDPKPAKHGSPNQLVSPSALNQKQQKQLVRNPFAATTRSQPSRPKNTTPRTSNKSSSSKCSHSLVETTSRVSSERQRPRSNGNSILLSSSRRSAFVPTSPRSGIARSTAVTHTITRAADIVTESSVSFETVTYTTTTVPRTVSSGSAQDKQLSSFKTATETCSMSTRTQSLVSYAAISRSDSITTSTFTSCTVTRPKTPASITSPMHSTYSVPAGGVLCSSPTIVSRAPPHTSVAGVRCQASSPAFNEACQQLSRLPSAPTTTTDETLLPQSRLVLPATLSTYGNTFGANVATAKSRVACSIRTTQSVQALMNVHTYATSTITGTSGASRALSQSSFGLPPGATLYAARKVPSSRVTRSQNVPVSTESQKYAILDGKGSYTTLTISPDFTATTCNSLVIPKTQHSNPVTAGFVSLTSSMTSDSIVRPGSHMLISIANSQMSPSTSRSYLLSPPLGSDMITARRSPASGLTHSDTTTGIATHTITTISSEAMNRIRSRLLIPIGHNVPSTGAALSSVPVSTTSSDSNRSRGPVTVIANQLITSVSPRDVSGTLTTATTSEVTTTSRTLFSATRGVYTLSAPITSSASAADPTSRTLNRVVIPVMSSIHATSNIQNSTTAASVSSPATNPTFTGGPTQGAYLITTGMGSTSSPTVGTTGRASRVIIPIIHNTSAATTSTTAANVSSLFSGNARDNTYPSSMGSIDVHSRLRNRLIVQATTEDSSMPGSTTPITAFTISRTRAPQSVYAIASAPTTYTSTTKPSEGTTLNPSTMTLITFESPSSGSPATTSSHNLLPPESASSLHTSPLTLSSLTTATPTLANTGNRYVIKLATTPSAPSTAASSVTAAVTTSITSAALSPPDHRFLEPQPVSRLRTFPGPRTYSVAQRSTAGNVLQRTAHGQRTVTPRAANKKVITNPAPLQIFADVVCPPTPTQSQTTTASLDQTKPRFTLSHSSGSSTLVVPQYKNTVSKNVSTVAHHNAERASSRFMSPRSSTDRFVLNRSVPVVSPRRAAPSTQSETQIAHTMSSVTQRTARPVRFTYADIRPQGRINPAVTTAADSAHTAAEPTVTTASNKVLSKSDK